MEDYDRFYHWQTAKLSNGVHKQLDFSLSFQPEQEKPPQARVDVDSQIPVLENLVGEEQQNL